VVITEVRIKLMEDNNERLQAFCSVTFDDAFVVRDLKIIEGTKGSFVAMPSRKLTDRCGGCGCKNHLRARYCNQCGHKLDEDRAVRDADGRAKLHADIAHPINSACREVIQSAVLKAYREERERSKMPGYVCSYDEYDAGDYEDTFSTLITELGGAARNGGEGGYRTHPGHGPAHRGTHSTQDAARSGHGHEEKREGGFGSGIL
jgi:stage V sporulation protein G